MKKQLNHFNGLDTLRFFSAFAIIIYHSTLGFVNRFYPSVKMFFHNLTLGVESFFIISGFLIVYLLLLEKEKTNSISLMNFYIRRTLRIFPLYFFVIGVAYCTYHTSNPEINFTKYAFFCGNFAVIEADKWTVGILNPLWSLSIEEHFYLVIPFLILLTPIKKLNYLFLGVIFSSIAFRFVATFHGSWMIYYCHTLSRMDSLAVGGLIAYYYHQDKSIFRNITSRYIGIALVFLVFFMSILDVSNYELISYVLFKKYLFIFPIVIIFIGFVLNDTNQQPIMKWFKNNKIINYLGKISFGLYMYHLPIGDFISQYEFMKTHHFIRILTLISLTILVSAISYELFEKQILKLKRKFEVI